MNLRMACRMFCCGPEVKTPRESAARPLLTRFPVPLRIARIRADSQHPPPLPHVLSLGTRSAEILFALCCLMNEVVTRTSQRSTCMLPLDLPPTDGLFPTGSQSLSKHSWIMAESSRRSIQLRIFIPANVNRPWPS